jgi:hypothetical protein
MWSAIIQFEGDMFGSWSKLRRGIWILRKQLFWQTFETGDRCYHFETIFAEKFGEKKLRFYSKHCYVCSLCKIFSITLVFTENAIFRLKIGETRSKIDHNQCCQMVCFQTKKQIWVNFGKSCNWRCWYILWTLGPFNVFCFILWTFGYSSW